MKKLLYASLAAVALVAASSVHAATHNEYEGFYGASPVAQQAGPDRVALENYGLLTTGTDGTATATGNGTTAATATLNKVSGTITTETLTTAAAATYTLTLTNSAVTSAASHVFVEIDNGTNSQGIPVKTIVTPGNGTVAIKVANLHASQALNGTLKVHFEVRR